MRAFLLGLTLLAVLAGCAHQQQPANVPVPQVVNANIEVAQANVYVSEYPDAPAFDVDAIVAQMQTKRRPFRFGVSSDAGVWVVCRTEVERSDDTTLDQLLAVAEIRAKRDVAAWQRTSISSEKSSEIYVEYEDGELKHSKEAFHSLTHTSTQALLRGMTMHSFLQDGDVLRVYFFTTGRTIDASAELEAQLTELPDGVVRTCGYGVISSRGLPVAQKQALQQALRNAVEQVMGATVIAQSQLMNNEKFKAKMVSRSMGTVKKYRIVQEGAQGTAYQVVVNAHVDTDALLDNYAALVRSMGNPGFFISCEDPDLQIALLDFFTTLGFNVVGDPAAAQFVVKSTCQYIPIKDSYYGDGLQIDTKVGVYDQETSQQLVSLGNVPRFSSTFTGNYHQIRQAAAAKAFKSMKKDLHGKLNQMVLDWVLNGRQVAVVFHNVPNADMDNTLLEAINWVPCATCLDRKREGDTMTAICTYIGATGDFEEFLRERLRNDLPADVPFPTTTRITLNSIEFEF